MDAWKVPSNLRGTVARITPGGQYPNGQPFNVFEIRRHDGYDVRVEVPVNSAVGLNYEVDLTEELAGPVALRRWWPPGQRPRFAPPPQLRG